LHSFINFNTTGFFKSVFLPLKTGRVIKIEILGQRKRNDLPHDGLKTHCGMEHEHKMMNIEKHRGFVAANKDESTIVRTEATRAKEGHTPKLFIKWNHTYCSM